MLSTIEFRLFAPRIERVFLTGSFNSWKDIEMSKENVTGQFSTKVDLEDGEYFYKFRILSRNEPNKMIDVIDPYATRVDDDEKGAIVKVSKGRKVNGNEYVWKYDEKKLPENKDLIIYEIFLADFTKEGTIRSAIPKLDYLANELGVNCIELMPVQACLLGHDWGYTIRHFFAVEPSYGSAEDLKCFIDECHARGMRVMLDCVFNHSHGACPLNKIDPTYWYYEGIHHPEHPEEVWGPEFNYDYEDKEHGKIKPALQFISDVIRFWIEEYRIDGMRFDAAKQIDNVAALKHFDLLCHSLRDPFYTVAEYVPATPAIVKPHGPVDGVWRSVAFPFQDIFEYPENRLFFTKLVQTGSPIEVLGYSSSTSLITFYACHDNERFLHFLNEIKYFDEEAFKRLKIATVLVMTGVGVPQIWMGDEWGEESTLGKEDRTTKISKLDWTAPAQPCQRSLLDLNCKLLAFRKSSAAIKSDNIHFFYQDADHRILAYSRWSSEANDLVVVLFNLSNKDQQNYRINKWPKNGFWQDVINQTNIFIEKNEFQIDLKSFESKIFLFKE